MATHSRRPRRLGKLAVLAFCPAFSAISAVAKPAAVIHSEVEITFGGQTFGFSGVEKSFSQSETGGRIVFDVTQLGTPGYTPLPQIDTNALEPTGNHWEVQSNLGARSYMFVGTCANETYTTTESGLVVRHLYLNCKDLSESVSP